jgi:hypothetical protein
LPTLRVGIEGVDRSRQVASSSTTEWATVAVLKFVLRGIEVPLYGWISFVSGWSFLATSEAGAEDRLARALD